VIQAFRRVASFAKTTWEETLLPVVRRTVRAIKPIVEGLGSLIRGIVRTISGLLSGDWEKAWDGAKETVRGAWKVIKTTVATAAENLMEYIRDLGPKLIKALAKAMFNSQKAIATGLGNAIIAAAKAAPGLAASALSGLGHAITSAISKGLGKINIFGDGLGKGDGLGITMSIPQFGTGGAGGGLMGARANMAPVAGIASRFGLNVRPDCAPARSREAATVLPLHRRGARRGGHPGGMLAFFRYMKNNRAAGSRS
jgi:hypothetical protein